MKSVTVGIVDYGIGNHASVIHSLRELGCRVRVSAEADVLGSTDLLILPGVGAFPTAMQALHKCNLIGYLRQHAREQRPIIGFCLGMQLLATSSHEMQFTAGLDIIPGEIVPLTCQKWHIGWNALECTDRDSVLRASDGEAFYFNHSYCYEGPAEFKLGISRHPNPIVAAIRRGNVVGLQFHPEKSQSAGRTLLHNLISDLTHD
ncbi:MAG: imidazole glycerol phosphate synthase subunit HisH [Phyllobacteriaceae bacterium]|nr:imidazole glycerol phosphate synthase subunit HisH [Phyllobacteriaceae bacterium]